eukprot:690437-Rhodomonas_salina.2
MTCNVLPPVRPSGRKTRTATLAASAGPILHHDHVCLLLQLISSEHRRSQAREKTEHAVLCQRQTHQDTQLRFGVTAAASFPTKEHSEHGERYCLATSLCAPTLDIRITRSASAARCRYRKRSSFSTAYRNPSFAWTGSGECAAQGSGRKA